MKLATRESGTARKRTGVDVFAAIHAPARQSNTDVEWPRNPMPTVLDLSEYWLSSRARLYCIIT